MALDKNNRVWLVYSIVFVAIITIVSEWIQAKGMLKFSSGFRHLAISLIFIVNWVKYGRRIRFNKYILFIVIMSFYLLLSYSVTSASPFNYILGIMFTFMFSLLFILGANTGTSIHNVYKLLKILLKLI